MRCYVDLHRTDGGAPYVLTTPYPRRTFRPADMETTLTDLELAPRSTVILEPAPHCTAAGRGQATTTTGNDPCQGQGHFVARLRLALQ